jgi:chromosome segregation ATPase
MTMDLAQAGQMLKWLDEERRRDKTILSSLQERLEAQAQQLARQEEQLTSLLSSVAGMEALLARVRDFTQTVEQFKTDVGLMLDDRDEKRRKEQREVDMARQLEMGQVKDQVAQLLDDSRRAGRLEDRLTAVQTESQRLNEVLQRLEGTVSDLSKRSDDRVQTVTYLEEQRRSDNRRIAALEAETTELRRRVESTDARMPLLDEAIQKERARVDEGLNQIKEFGKVTEELRVADFRREQQAKKWAGQAEESRQEMERLQRDKGQLLEQQQRAERAVGTLETFRERLEARLNEVAEMQRLAEDRLKRQWEEWQAAQEKDRRREELGFEEEKKRQERVNKDHDARLSTLQDKAAGLQKQLLALMEGLSAEAHGVIGALQDELARVQELSQLTKEI